MCIYVHACMHVYMYVCIHDVCMHMCAYVKVCMYVYIHWQHKVGAERARAPKFESRSPLNCDVIDS